MGTKRLSSTLSRDLFVLEDESNPGSSKVDQIYGSTILDQVFDNLSPTNKNLRTILEELRQEIITGGRGNIVFPVTSVNGKTEDVVITANDLGLGRVDNTRDADKPLSVPQREAIMNILQAYDFNVNLEDLYNHVMDTNNPHDVTIEHINRDDVLVEFIQRYIGYHNNSRHNTVHMDIRRSLSALWLLVDDINNNLEDRVGNVLSAMDDHNGDDLAHQQLFDKKEDKENKALSFSTTIDNDYKMYPSTRAVVEFVANQLNEFRGTLPDVKNWIDDIVIVDSRSKLPTPTERYLRKAYFIRNGITSHDEVAICRLNPDDKTYSWDISQFGTYSKFNPNHFVDSSDGMSIKMDSVIDAIISENGMLDTSLSNILKDYYTKKDIDSFHFVSSVHILPGTQDGTIRYYINEDMTTMSEDIKVSGLKRLAYLEWITEDQIWDQAVHERHILSKAITHRHLQEKIVTKENLSCKYGTLFANTEDSTGSGVNEVTLIQLADYLRPLIGGWPDPNTPGGNPWQDALDDSIMHPHRWEPNKEHSLGDYSYAQRFRGKISVLPNMDIKITLSELLTLGTYKMIEAGGTWQYQTDPEEWTILGGSNITGHTFATVNMTTKGLYFESISIGNRMEAEYDIWVKYVKTAEIDKLQPEIGV